MRISVQLGPNALARLGAVCEFFGLTPGVIFTEAPGYVAAFVRDVTKHGTSLVAYRPAGELMFTGFINLPTLEDFCKNDQVHAIAMSPIEIGGMPLRTRIDVMVDRKHIREVNSYVKAKEATEAYGFCLWAYLSLLRTATESGSSTS